MIPTSEPVGKAIHRRTGRTFYVATRLLPKRVRRATYVLYGFFRIADEIVDDPAGDSPTAQAARLEALRAGALGAVEAEDPVVSAFADLVVRYDVPEAEVHSFVDAMKSDIHTDRYETYADLEAYMRGSAAAVGVMMTAVMGPDRPERATPHAVALGEAFQLTNFLRDVREDVLERGRIYVPRRTLARHGVSESAIEKLEPSSAFAAAVVDELHRAERLYEEGVAGIKYLPADCQFPVLLAAVLYAEHHRLIRARNYDVLSATPRLGTARTAWLALRTRARWALHRDPEAVFRAVSAVGGGESRPRPERGASLPTR